MVRAYTADSIEVNQNLKHIRVRPNAYIPSRDISGQVHMQMELISNSIDEEVLKPDGGTIYILIFRDTTKNAYQMIVSDDGRGIPSKRLVEVSTVLGASGKFGNNSSFVASAGQFGFGMKVAAALSSRFRIISSNYLEKISASVYLKDGEMVNHEEIKTKIPNGVTIAFEPDLQNFFTNGAEFISSGYLDLVSLCKQLNIFNDKINFQVYIYDRFLPNTFWKAPIDAAYQTFINFVNSNNKSIVYDSSSVGDKTNHLFEIWKVNSPIVFSDQFIYKGQDEDRLKYDIKYFLSKKSATGNSQYFITVNNVALVDKTENSATMVFMKVFRNKIARYLDVDNLKKFVLNEYKFSTLLLAIGIQYDNAELAGTTKSSFKDSIFAKQFQDSLTSLFNSKGDEYWGKVVEVLRSDIELRYAQFYDAPMKKAEVKRIFADLNYGVNYKECKSSDNTKCELYIVEGTSAGNITSTRDNEYQAIYETRGKPFNAATTLDNIAENRKRLLRDPVYQDILKILNIGPNTTDMNSSRFNKIIIAADADPNGSSISALYIQGFYIINPKIIESGMVYVAKPPLYSMNIAKNKKLFLRDKVALLDARIKYLYKPSLDIQVVTSAGETKMTDDVYRDMCYMINYIGDEFDQVSRSLNIPLLILERLVFGLEYIYPKLNVNELCRVFESNDEDGFVRVQMNYLSNYLIVSLGPDDHVIGLDSIVEVMKNHILPLVIRYKYRDLLFKVRSLHKGATLTEYRPMSMMMLYICMKQLDELFKVSRYKGLGEMEGNDCYATLMNPKTRSLTHITSVGDEVYNYKLVGKDSLERKKLLADTNTISAKFLRESNLF